MSGLPGRVMAQLQQRDRYVAVLLWLVAVVLYFPAAKAGWVIDAIGSLYNIQHQDFWDYINTRQSTMQSNYQVYTFVFWVCYKLWGVNLYLWSLLFITAHATCGYLLYRLCRQLLHDSGLPEAMPIALGGALLFIICPHVSEAVIWKACFHYQMGLGFILGIALLVVRYQHNPRPGYKWLALALFAISLFSLEVWFISPVVAIVLTVYYRYGINTRNGAFRKTVFGVVAPMVVLLDIYLAVLFIRYGYLSPHMHNTLQQPLVAYLSKPPKYLFHIIELGRYYPIHTKEKVYHLLESTSSLIAFYAATVTCWAYIIWAWSRLSNYARAMAVLLALVTLTLGIIISSPFPGSALLVFYDRYTYFADGFIYTLLILVVYRLSSGLYTTVLFGLYALINLFFTIRVNLYWKHSAYITNRLLTEMPASGNRTVLLLNIPENLQGVAMIGAQPDGEYKAMRTLLTKNPIPNPVYDVVSYNMTTPQDGAHVQVINDSTIRVTLNQWGTWWWYEGHGAPSYQNNIYKVNMVDGGHWYELTLKRPASELQLLYNVADRWREVDMNKQGVEQW